MEIPRVPAGLLWTALNSLDARIVVQELVSFDVRSFRSPETAQMVDQSLKAANARASALFGLLQKPGFKKWMSREQGAIFVEPALVEAAAAARLTELGFDRELIQRFEGS